MSALHLSIFLTFVILKSPSIAENTSLKSLRDKLPKNQNIVSNKAYEKPNIFFKNSTDTIQISSPTQFKYESTYEARIYIPKELVSIYSTARRGFVFSELTDSEEHKTLSVTSNRLAGGNFPTSPPGRLMFATPLLLDTWHHIAFVQAGGSQRLYFNGQLVGSRPIRVKTDIGDSDEKGYVGARHYVNKVFTSFIGHIDSLRLSNIARYRGNKFEPPTGKMQPDSHTVLLYNFELEDYYQRDGLTLVKDRSGSDRHGILGIGFSEATSPTIVIPPALQSELASENSHSWLWQIGIISFGILAIGGSAIYLYKSKW